ncbi:MAG: hypothetical protein NVS2B9_19840 [Myxococcales bacterium]
MSGLRTSTRAAVSAALLVCAAACPALAQDASGVLTSGVTYTIRPDPAQSGAAVALWYRAPAAGFDAAPSSGLSRLAADTVAASTPVTGTPLAQLVARSGGRISIAVYPDSVAITALVPPDHVAQTVRAMTASFFAPVITAQGLRIAQRDATEDAVYRSLGSEAIEDALGSALFAAGPLHDGLIGTAQSLAETKLERVRAFAERAFRPANAILVLTGNVDPAVLGGVASRSGAQSAPEAAAVQTPRAGLFEPIRRAGNITGTGLGWIGPPIVAEAEATTLDFIADALFAPRSGVVAKALGKRKVTVVGKFVTYRNPGVFLVSITGEDAAAALPIVEKAIADAARPMPAAAFAAARAAFVYRILGDMSTPAEVADTFGWYTVEGDAPYAPAEGGTQGRYFSLAAQLTPDAVARTVAKYLSVPPAVVNLVKAPVVKGTRT